MEFTLLSQSYNTEEMSLLSFLRDLHPLQIGAWLPPILFVYIIVAWIVQGKSSNTIPGTDTWPKWAKLCFLAVKHTPSIAAECYPKVLKLLILPSHEIMDADTQV